MSASDFRMIRPLAVTDAILTSSTVPEAVVTEYAGATTYALGDIRGVTTGTAQIVYKSLQAANTGNTPASSPLWWQLLGTVYAAYAGGTTYAAGDIVTDLTNHLLYTSVVSGNLGNALSDITKWTSAGATNRWKQFDGGVATQTTQPEEMSYVFTPGQVVTTLAGLNAYGSSVTLTQSVSGYSETRSLVTHLVDNWLDFFYEELVLTGDFAFDNIPPYPASTLTLTVANAGDDVSLGSCIIGKGRTLGTTLWGISGSSLSYSTTTTNTFGNVTIVPRGKSKLLNFEMVIRPGLESEVFRILTQYMDTPIVVIGAIDYSMAITYCYLGQWDVPISNSGKPATIETRGLV